MEMNEKKSNSLTSLMETSMGKIREMVDSNSIIGEPITTPDGVTLIPVSRLSFGFGCGGGHGRCEGGAGGFPGGQGRRYPRAACGHPRCDHRGPRDRDGA